MARRWPSGGGIRHGAGFYHVLGILLFSSLRVVVVNILVDVLHGLLAPRKPWVNIHAAESTRTMASPPMPSHNRRVLRMFLRTPAAVTGLVLPCLMTALLAPLVFPRDPFAIIGPSQIWPGQDSAFPLGTDAYGRDILIQLAHGARVSLEVGVVATRLSLGAGTLIGVLAG